MHWMMFRIIIADLGRCPMIHMRGSNLRNSSRHPLLDESEADIIRIGSVCFDLQIGYALVALYSIRFIRS